MNQSHPQVPEARVTLRAYQPAPARIELVYRPLAGRLARTVLSIVLFWGAIPFVMWVPPHYPWVAGAFVTGIYLAHRAWTGRYRVHAFAGVCPRCGHPVSLGLDRAISLPHTLTCYHCHFEPRLEVSFDADPPRRPGGLEHRTPECIGSWEVRWLADEPFLVCDHCFTGAAATPAARRAAEEENERSHLLTRLTREGRPLI